VLEHIKCPLSYLVRGQPIPLFLFVLAGKIKHYSSTLNDSLRHSEIFLLFVAFLLASII